MSKQLFGTCSCNLLGSERVGDRFKVDYSKSAIWISTDLVNDYEISFNTEVAITSPIGGTNLLLINQYFLEVDENEQSVTLVTHATNVATVGSTNYLSYSFVENCQFDPIQAGLALHFLVETSVLDFGRQLEDKCVDITLNTDRTIYYSHIFNQTSGCVKEASYTLLAGKLLHAINAANKL